MSNRSLLRRAVESGIRRVRTFNHRRIFRTQLANAKSLRIVVGASGVFESGWIPTEIDVLNLLDETDWQMYFAENSVDAILAEHVWEHLTDEQGRQAAKNCYRYLKRGGYLRVAVPDGFHPDPAYIESVRVGGSGAGADDHKVLYDCDSFRPLFEQVGFCVEPLEYFDASGTFHFTDWSRDSGMVHRSKRYDERNQDGGLHYTSLILDCQKPA